MKHTLRTLRSLFTVSALTCGVAIVCVTGSAEAQNAIPNEAPDFPSCTALHPIPANPVPGQHPGYALGTSGAGVRRPARAGASVSNDLGAQPTTRWCDAYYVRANEITIAGQRAQVLTPGLYEVPTPPVAPQTIVRTYDRRARQDAAAAQSTADTALGRANLALTRLATALDNQARVNEAFRRGLATEREQREANEASFNQRLVAEAAVRETSNGEQIARLRQLTARMATVETELAAMRAHAAAVPDAHVEFALIGSGRLNTAGAAIGAGLLGVGLVLQWDAAALRLSGGYGTGSQQETPGAGYVHVGRASADALIGVGRFQGVAGLGGSVASSDAVGGLEWSIDARGGVRVLFTEPPAAGRRPTGPQFGIEIDANAGFMLTHGSRNGQPLHGGGLGLGLELSLFGRF